MKNKENREKEINNEIEVNKETDEKDKKQRKIIIILAILLALSVAGLAARYLYLQHLASTPTTIEIPDNLVGDKEDENNGSKNDNSSAGVVVPANGSGQTGQSAVNTDGKSDSDKTSGKNDSTSDGQQTTPSGDDENPGDNTGDNSGDNPGGGSTGDNQGGNTGEQPTTPTTPTTPSQGGGGGSSSGRKAIRLDLFEGNSYTKEAFNVTNMFPGDGLTEDETKYYCVRIYHDRSTTLYFRTTVTAATTDS